MESSSYRTRNFLESCGRVSGLGRYSVPTGIADVLTCWSDHEREGNYWQNTLGCSSGNEAFVTDELSTGALSFSHRYVAEVVNLNDASFPTPQ